MNYALYKLGFIRTSLTCSLFFFFLYVSRIAINFYFIDLYGFLISIFISFYLFFKNRKIYVGQILLTIYLLACTFYSLGIGLIPELEIVKFLIYLFPIIIIPKVFLFDFIFFFY